MLIAEEVALNVVRRLASVLARIRRHDRGLHDQVRRAASSIVLNVAEAQASDGGNARLRYGTAAVSAALRVAVAWGYVAQREVLPIEARLDRVRRLLWGLRR